MAMTPRSSLVRVVVLVLGIFVLVAAAAQQETEAASNLEVFIVPHSHDDVGWIIPMEQYYTSAVQYIIDTVIDQLMQDQRRRFIMVEVGFIKRWFDDASSVKKQQLKQLVAAGQIEFILGGIVMSDEAAASYVARINQLQEGHAFLLKEFGEKGVPRIGWQVDPFGASRGTATLFAWDCFDALVIDRVPYWKKTQREEQKQMEFIWHGTNNLGVETDIFTHLMDDYMYCTPQPWAFGDDWDIYEPPNPNPPVETYNIASIADQLVRNFKLRSSWYSTNNLLWPFGCDFNYQNAVQMYKNMDRLIEYINNNNATFGVHVQYALLSDYFNAVNAAQKQQGFSWPEFSDDFFPYNDNNVSYWTGYYTSRNVLKGLSRKADGVLRNADTMNAVSIALGVPINHQSIFADIDYLRLQNAIAQHHDAISGTARPITMADYEHRVNVGIMGTDRAITDLFQVITMNKSKPKLSIDSDSSMTILGDGKILSVVVYNSLGWSRQQYVRVHSPTSSVTVRDSQNKVVPAQVITNSNQTSYPYTIYFQASLPPLGVATYFVEPLKRAAETHLAKPIEIHLPGECLRQLDAGMPLTGRCKHLAKSEANDFTISNDNYVLTFDGVSGLLKQLQRTGSSAISLMQQYLQYPSSTDEKQPSGAYIFRNAGNATALAGSLTVTVWNGQYVQQIEQVWQFSVNISSFTPKLPANITQVYRLYNGQGQRNTTNFIEIEHAVGPLNGNQELITRWSTPAINSAGNFAQDDTGLLTMQRKFNSSQSLPIPGNYYPMVSTAYIEDPLQRLMVLTSQSEGCSSLASGELEIMLHRRTLQDDNRGVQAPLNDTHRIHVTHWAVYDTPNNAERVRHQYRIEMNFPLEIAYGTASSVSSWVDQYVTKFSIMNALPPNVHLLSLEVYDGRQQTIVLRLQHLFEAGTVLGQPVTVDLSTLFTQNVLLVNPVPMTLSANKELKNCKRMTWTPSALEEPQTPAISIAGTTVTLQPSQIATFTVLLQPKPQLRPDLPPRKRGN